MKHLGRKLSCLLACSCLIAIGLDARAGTTSYTYDALGRVTSAAYPNGACVTYSYDAAGNRTQYAASSAPVAQPVSATVATNSTHDPIALIISCGAPTSVAVSTPAGHGTAMASGTSVTYSPNSGYSGADSFKFTATNAAGTSAPATVSLTVTTVAPPIANPVSSTVAFDSTGNPIPLNITGGAPTSVAASTPPATGRRRQAELRSATRRPAATPAPTASPTPPATAVGLRRPPPFRSP